MFYFKKEYTWKKNDLSILVIFLFTLYFNRIMGLLFSLSPGLTHTRFVDGKDTRATVRGVTV